MADKTGIEWTDATWNPVRGCTRVSEGCRNCYAERVAARFSGPGQAYEALARMTPSGPRWTGKTRLVPEMLDAPLRWRKPRRIFVNSMSDLFHESLSDQDIEAVFGVMATAGHHTFQVLTKRPARMLEWFGKTSHGLCAAELCGRIEFHTPKRKLSRLENMRRGWPWPLPNVWLGVSVEDQQRADERIPLLLDTPAAVRFISAEPLLGPVDLCHLQPGDPPVEIDALRGTHGVLRPHRGTGARLDWVIAGGESGPGARPMHPEWARSLRDQCVSAGVPFFFKQWGEWAPDTIALEDAYPGHDNCLVPLGPATKERALREGRHLTVEELRTAAHVRRVGTKRAGRELDDRTWDEFPRAEAV